MRTANSQTRHLCCRRGRTVRSGRLAARRLLPAALAALAIGGWTPQLRACDFEVAAGAAVSLDGDATVDCVSVGAGGSLTIIAGTLTLNGQDTSIVDGDIILESCAAVLRIAEDHSLAGSGCIDGRCSGAAIAIGGGKTLTSQITISGMLQIRPAAGATGATFVNGAGGRVRADAGGTLDVRPDAVCGAGDWQVSASSAVLQFTSGTSCLSGPLHVDGGLLSIVGQVCTTGVLDFEAGQVGVAPDACFSAGGSCPCQQ